MSTGIGAELAALSDDRFAELLAAAPVRHIGIGGESVTLEFGGTRVFAKRVPLTEPEARREHVQSTVDLFGLPTSWQYGIGSVGYGVWRELAALRTMTERAAPVTRLYHWRVLPGAPRFAIEAAERERMLELGGGSPGVRRRLDALGAARASVLLCCEHLPWTLHDWLNARVADGTVDAVCTRVEGQLLDIAAALADARLLHFDAHFENILTDGNRLYLGDFGLVTSPDFELSTVEREFVARHDAHDACYLAMQLVAWLLTALTGAKDSATRGELLRRCAAGEVPEALPPAVAGVVRRYAPVADVLGRFYRRLRARDRDLEFPAGELAKACAATGFTPPAVSGHR